MGWARYVHNTVSQTVDDMNSVYMLIKQSIFEIVGFITIFPNLHRCKFFCSRQRIGFDYYFHRQPVFSNGVLLTRRWSGVRVLDLAQTAGGTTLWQIMRHVSWGFCEWAFFSEVQAILCLKWTIFDKNGVSFFSNNFLNISLI